MLERIEATSARGALLNLSLTDTVSGLLLDDVKGLDPVKATITSSSFANLDGTDYQSSRREDRNITIRLLLEPNWAEETVKVLRNKIYAFFMPKSPVDLRFYSTDMDPVKISGRVESCETPLFTAEPAVDISIICFDPDFVEENDVIFSGSTVSTLTNTNIPYLGTTETGFVFTLNVNRILSEFSIYLDNKQIDFDGTLQNLDILKISTVSGSKYVRRIRAGVETSLLYGIPAQSVWLNLYNGDNALRVYAVGNPVPYTIAYTRKYGGL